MRSLTIRSLRRLWFGCVSAIVVLLIATFPARAQHIQFTQGSVGSGLDNTIEIPLRSYPGRGISLPVTLKYSSRVWRIGYLSTVNNGQYQSIGEAIYSEYATAGWTTTLDLPVVEWPKNTDTYYYSGKPFCHVCDSNLIQFRVGRLFMHMPDGSTHEMRKSDVPYQGSIQMSGIFYAVDGSRMRYDSTDQTTGVLYLPNGARYELSATTSKYIDANGNTLTYTAGNRTWEDSVGRSVAMPFPANPQAQDYTYNMPGFENNPVPIIFRFKTLANALTPVNGLPPALKVVGTQYLPNPSAAPTGPSGGNYPQLNQTPTLFYADVDNADPDALMQTWIVGRNQPGNTVFNPVVLTDIIYPNGLSYKFSYNEYGEIDKVIYPTGAFEQYTYVPFFPIGDVRTPYSQANRCVTSRKISPSGTGNDLLTWTYTGSSRDVIATAPDSSKTETIRANFATPEHTGTHGTITKYWPFGFEDSRQGMLVEERAMDANLVMLRRRLYQYEQTAASVPPSIPLLDNTYKTACRNPRQTRVTNIILDTGGAALAQTENYLYDTTYEMSLGVDRTNTTERHFVSVTATNAQSDAIDLIPTGTSIARETAIVYLDDSGYRNRNILGLPVSQSIKDGNSNIVAKTEWVYDEAAYTAAPYPDLDNVTYFTDPGTPLRGNLTTVKRWVDIGLDIHLDTHTTYDEAGNPVAFKNERLNVSTMEFSAAYKRGLLTKTITAVPDDTGGHASATAFTKLSAYDFTTGLITSTTDENGQISNFSYKDDDDIHIDVMNRLRKITRPDGGWTRYTFHDVAGDMFYSTETKQDATRTLLQYDYVDGLGRVSRIFLSEGDGNFMVTDHLYDLMGRALKTSNPYRTATLGGTVNPNTAPYWTSSVYDALGRVTTLTMPDGSTVTTQYSGIYTTVTDQAGKMKRQKIDALGRTVRVDEPDNNGSLGAVDTPTQPTSYTFNVLGQIVQVDQGQQHRYFRYDAIGRMTHEKQIEAKVFPFTTNDASTGANPTTNTSWSSRRIYDETLANVNYKGLLTSSYDARQILTQFSYDNLNRVTTIVYSDSVTPRVDQYYDNVPFTVAGDNRAVFNKGRLTERRTATLGSIPSTAERYNHDLMGRTIHSQQAVGAESYTMGYTYDLGSSLLTEKYPSGRIVTYSYDASARMTAVASGATNYLSNFVYGDQGMITSMTLGSGTVESYLYNSRMQVSRIDWTRSGNQIQRYNYKYGVFNPTTGSVDETKNDGQIAQVESYIGGAKQWQQNFTYDTVRRLKTTREKRGDNDQQSYLTSYTYDIYGNRFQPQAQNPNNNPFSQVWIEEDQIAATTNRFTSGITYDDAGNVIEDTRFRNLAFDYDANNRQRASSNLDGSNRVTSVYSASGQRLATMVNNEIQSISVYDSTGTLLAEYGNSPLSDGTQYVLTDIQGTPRVRTNPSGVPTSRHDYLPFGEELAGNIGMRSPSQGYGNNDGVNKKYAAMETDASGLSHTLWRKYDSMSARWTTTDPYSASMDVNNPQSLNRYSYVGNDPVNETDPLGLAPADMGIVQTDDPMVASELERQALMGTLNAIGSAQQHQHKPKDDTHKGNQAGESKDHETKPAPTGTTDPAPQGLGLAEKGLVFGLGTVAAAILLGEGGAAGGGAAGGGAAGTIAIAGAGGAIAGEIAKGAGGGLEGAIIKSGPEAPESKAPVKSCISDHGPRGSATERTVLAVMKVDKYKGKCLNGTLPDAIDGTRLIEVKDAKTVSLRKQIRGELKTAHQEGLRFVLVITERTTHLSGPLIEAIDAAKGQILRYHGNGTIVDETDMWLNPAAGGGRPSGGGFRFNGERTRGRG